MPNLNTKRAIRARRNRMPIDPAVGGRVRALRTQRDMTQADLAEPEYTKAYISLLENGRSRASVKAMQIFATKLGVPLSDLMPVETPRLSHLDDRGQARMVDVGAKAATDRRAVARGRLVVSHPTIELVRSGDLPKGDVLATARIAGIMAAKKTSELIPLTHPLPLTHVAVTLSVDEGGIGIEATAATTGPTGVELEALTAVAVAGLTLYDMLKSVERGARLTDIRLVEKSGGKTGTYTAE